MLSNSLRAAANRICLRTLANEVATHGITVTGLFAATRAPNGWKS